MAELKLPTLEDFTESSLLSKEKTEAQKTVETEAARIAEANKKAEEEKLNQGKTADEKAKAEKAKADAEAAKKAEEDKKKAGTTVELTQEQIDALVKKAETAPDTLTAEERKVLIDKKLFEEESNIWEDVNALHGIKLEVDYGKTNPDSPEGIVIREKKLMDYAMERQLEYLEKTYPGAFKFLQHAANGGNLEDLMPSGDEIDYSKVTLDKDDKESQKAVLLDWYLAKGFDEKKAARLVEDDEDSETGLLTAAQNALKEFQTSQKARQDEILKNAELRKEALEKQNVQFKSFLKGITDEGKLGDFQISTKEDKEGFYNYALNNIYFDGKSGYQVVLPLNDKSVIPVLQQLFFGFKEGKLDALVKTKAQTLQAQKLLKRVSQNADKTATIEDEKKKAGAKSLPTLKEYTVET